MLFYVDLTMGEGISGRDNVGAATAVLYSCMGIALANRTERRGGLYHYPAGSLANANVASTLRRMVSDIQPTDIVITPAGGGVSDIIRSGDDDITAVRNHLTQLAPGASVSVAPRGVSAALLWQDGHPVFNTLPFNLVPPVYDEEEGRVSGQFRTTMSTGPRDLGQGVLYYGGDGETTGVLEQGLRSSTAPGPSRPGRPSRARRAVRKIRDRCIIM